MITGKWIVMSAAALMMGSVLFAADDAMAPATDAPPAHHHKVIKPYSQLSDLTDDQKSQIIKAHSDYLKEEKELLAKEKSDIEAILTDAQKAELKTLEENGTSDRKEKSARKKEMNEDSGDATTQPAQ
jgi:Spy/CpxP family protein refolding chaperone